MYPVSENEIVAFHFNGDVVKLVFISMNEFRLIAVACGYLHPLHNLSDKKLIPSEFGTILAYYN